MSRSMYSRPIVHQAEPSVNSDWSRSSYSTTYSSGTSSPRSARSYYGERVAREYGAAGHSMDVHTRNDVVVINRHQTSYDVAAPTPRHDSWASKDKSSRSSKSKSKK